MTAIWILIAVFALLALRVPVAFALLAPTLVYVLLDDALTMGIVLQRLTGTLNSFPLVAVPLFILVGYLADASGMATKLINAMLALFGRLRGALGYANVGSSVAFSLMSGSATADAAAMGSIMGKSMKRNGYKGGFTAGLTGASSMIGPVMPPSVAAVIFASLAQTSVSNMFLAGILPALLVALMLFIYVFFYTRNKPELKTAPLGVKEGMKAILHAVPVMGTPIILLGGILGGLFTPTEAASVAVVYLVLVSFATRSLSFKRLGSALMKTAETTGRVMLIACVGGMLAYILAREGAARDAAQALMEFTDQTWVFLLLLNIVLLLIGLFLEPVSALLITVPIVMPIALEYGIDPLHLGVIMILNLSIGLLTPPVGLVLFVLSQAMDTDLREVFRGMLPALVPLVITLLLVTYMPIISMWIPDWASG